MNPIDLIKSKSSPKMYIYHEEGEGPTYYAYGDPWVAQALYMDNIRHKTPEEAMNAWERYQGRRAEQFEAFVKKRIEFEPRVTMTVDNTTYESGPEPFCPFIFSGYCNEAYSDECYSCDHAVNEFLGIKDEY